MTEQELLVDCLRRLNHAEVTYYLTGSMASNYWGLPRTTHDLDFVIQLPPSAVGKLVSAFTPDYFIDEASVRAAYQPPHQFNAIDTRSALKVEAHDEGRAYLAGVHQNRPRITCRHTARPAGTCGAPSGG